MTDIPGNRAGPAESKCQVSHQLVKGRQLGSKEVVLTKYVWRAYSDKDSSRNKVNIRLEKEDRI